MLVIAISAMVPIPKDDSFWFLCCFTRDAAVSAPLFLV